MNASKGMCIEQSNTREHHKPSAVMALHGGSETATAWPTVPVGIAQRGTHGKGSLKLPAWICVGVAI